MNPVHTLGKVNQRKLRQYFIAKMNLKPSTRIQTIAKELNAKNIDEAYELMKNSYNKTALTIKTVLKAQRKEKKSRRNTIVKKLNTLKFVDKSNANKFILKPTQSTFKSYWSYDIPEKKANIYYNVVSKQEYEATNRMVSEEGDVTIKPIMYTEIGHEVLARWCNYILQYIEPVVARSIREHTVIKTYSIVDFDCMVKDDDGKMKLRVFNENLGSIITSSVFEYREYFFKGVFDAYNKLLGKGYCVPFEISHVTLSILKFNPIRGSSYAPLPDSIRLTKAVINIKNTDQLCFLWCCIASRHIPNHHAERVSHYTQYKNEWKYKETDFPMAINRIHYFEKNNNVNINVYTYDNNEKVPVHISKQNNTEVINLFLYDNHYSLIQNFSRFCGTKNHVCPNCLAHYSNDGCYKRHLEVCKTLNENGSLVVMPEPDTHGNMPTIKFKDYSKQKRLPVVMYADFEASVAPASHKCANVVAQHKANSFRIRIQADVDLGIPLDYTYTGDDCDVKFVELLVLELEGKIQARLNELAKLHEKPVLTQEQEAEFQSCTDCKFCKRKLRYFNVKDKCMVNDRVRDHDHFTGKYEGASHNKCNIKSHQVFKGKVKIPVIFHNANYDIRCFINAFRKIKGDNFVECISGVPCNMEIYKCLNINSFNIICSYAHLSSSLDTLLKNLPDSKKKSLYTIVSPQGLAPTTPGEAERFAERYKLINKKGFYPYEMITSVEKLDIPLSQLKREHFNSKLNLSKISDADWEHVQTVIETFGFKTFREYHDLYLQIDVLGLQDVFEYHRELSYNTYGLDPAHFIGLPSFTWTAGLKHTGVELEQLTDMDMYMFCERWKKGGVSVISHKHAKANNPYLPDYDEEKENSYIMQLDCNNLYGWAMCQMLPISGFQWADMTTADVESYKPGAIGFCLEVDLEYPKHLHDEHNDYPLAPEHMEINGHKKLAPNLLNKTNYVVHIDNLKYYLSKGMVLTKIHKALQFDQSNWLETYINHNSKLRQKATNDFEKDYYKLLNNAFYGKTMENVRDRVNIQFCMTKEKFDKHTQSPLFANQINIFQEDGLALVKTHKRTVSLDKPIYIGACVLDLSKLLMYKFHYDTMKVRYPNAEMMKTDTDSLLYFIKTDDVYADMKHDTTLQKTIEFSNYPKAHPLYNCDRKKVPGLFQDECTDGQLSVISEYVGLRAKSYANKLFVVEEQGYEFKKKSKGVARKHLEQRVGFEDYQECLFSGKSVRLGDTDGKENHHDKIYSFKSINMVTYSIEQSKVTLSSKDDKRIPMDDGIHTYAIGHFRT